MHPPLPGDKSAAFIGLAAGAVSILVTVYVIVWLTNRSFESHAAAPHAPAPAAAPAPGAPASATPAPSH
jgi:predicted cobalt transporter CbtA